MSRLLRLLPVALAFWAMSWVMAAKSWARKLCRMECRMESWVAGESLDEPSRIER